jgi:GH25 family lysozyme M1 (1,4-beta-N-acetylmuramidase)
MKRFLYTALLSAAVFYLTGCASETAGMAETETEAEEETQNDLFYVDARGTWHDMVIDPDVPQNDYDWSCLSNDGQDISYTGDDRYRIRKGIDVSHHQGPIDWHAVRRDGYEFAIIRIVYRGYGEEGKLCLDSSFETNIDQAHKAGLDVGVYVFSQAVNEEEAEEEADLVIEALSEHGIELPVVYDPELIPEDTARTDNVSGEQFTANAVAFCKRIQKAGYQPMIYSNLVWEASLFDLEQLSEYPIWYADYAETPQTPYAFEFWQYSESGQVDGVEGKCDLDVQFIRN